MTRRDGFLYSQTRGDPECRQKLDKVMLANCSKEQYVKSVTIYRYLIQKRPDEEIIKYHKIGELINGMISAEMILFIIGRSVQSCLNKK